TRCARSGGERWSRVFAAEDARHGAAAGCHRTRARSIRVLRDAIRWIDAARRRQLHSSRSYGYKRRCPGVLQYQEGLDLRGLERNSAEHHGETGARARLTQRNFKSSIISNGVSTACSSMKRTST